MKKAFLFIFILIFSNVCVSEEIKLFKNFPADNPMSYQFVRAIEQDPNGFIWIGTQEGLHRFDGYQLVSFHHDSEKADSLSSNVVSRILIDGQQRFWIGTHGRGLNLYMEENDGFFHFTSNSKSTPLTNDNINALLEDSKGRLWVGTDKGINIISGEPGDWSNQHILQSSEGDKQLTHEVVHAMIETPNGQIWVGTNGGGISVFDLQGNFVKSIKYGDIHASVYANKFINSLLYDQAGYVWIGTVDSGVLKYDLQNETFVQYKYVENAPDSVASNTIQSIYQDSKQRIWIATDKGMVIHDPETKKFNRFNHAPNNPYSISNDFVLTFFEDKSGMMWIGTFTGVNRWDPNMTSFSQYSTQTNPEMQNGNITSFTQLNNSEVLFSTYSGGIYRMDLNTKDISRMNFSGFFAEKRIMTLFSDGGFLWVGTRSSGAYQINLGNKSIRRFVHDVSEPNSLSANSVTDIIKDKHNRIWISTFHQGLNKLNDNGSFTRYSVQDNLALTGPSSNHILQMLEDEQGILWLTTYGGGLNRFDPQTHQFIHLKHDSNNNKSIASDLAWFAHLDDNKNLWVGTQASGLSVLSYQDRLDNSFNFSHLNTKDGLKSLTVYGITQDNYGDIWLSSNKGISRYNQTDKSFKHFDLSHGLVDMEYSHGAIFKDLSNNLYFGTGKGFTSVNPETLHSNQSPPDVKLTNILKLNEPMNFEQPLSSLQLLELDYSDQIISFEYVGLNYSNPASTQYKYRLLGFDQEWIDAGTSRRATYTNLPAGNYQLQVIAGNNDNIWSSPGLSLNLIVKPAPWRTWWAYLIYALLIAVALLTYSRLLNRKLVLEQEQKQYLKQQVHEKTQEFQQKNVELEQANLKLENAATTDKLTGVKSRRYLDIYIEQASQLMSQIHENLLPVQRNILPRLYLIMVRIDDMSQVSNSAVVDLTDLLLYSRNKDDLVIRWSEDTFAIIGYEKEDNARELASRLCSRFEQVVGQATKINMAYSFYPFNFEQPMDLSWDQVSVLTEYGLKLVNNDSSLCWLGMYAPKALPFNHLEVLQQANSDALAKIVKIKTG